MAGEGGGDEECVHLGDPISTPHSCTPTHPHNGLWQVNLRFVIPSVIALIRLYGVRLLGSDVRQLERLPSQPPLVRLVLLVNVRLGRVGLRLRAAVAPRDCN